MRTCAVDGCTSPARHYLNHRTMVCGCVAVYHAHLCRTHQDQASQQLNTGGRK